MAVDLGAAGRYHTDEPALLVGEGAIDRAGADAKMLRLLNLVTALLALFAGLARQIKRELDTFDE